jgi:hypothetical protein
MPQNTRDDQIRSFNDRAQRLGWPSRCDSDLSFNSPMLREALSVWREKAGASPFPSRAEMTPRAMKNFLTNLAIVEVVGAAETFRYRIRLAGTWIDRNMMSASDRFLDEYLPEPFLERWQATFRIALGVEGPVRCFTGRVEYHNQEFLEAETFCGALGNPGEPPDALLVVMTAQSRNVTPRIGDSAAVLL